MKEFLMMFTLACALVGAPVAHAIPMTFKAHLDGPSEAPTNASTGWGDAVVVFDTDLHTLSVDVTFGGLLGLTTASHIHCCTTTPGVGTSGVATEVPFFDSFPTGVSSGSYLHLFDMTQASSFNPAFVTAHGSMAQAELDLLSSSFTGSAYLNIHTDKFPGGEIRGFLVSVPEPSSVMLLSFGLLVIGFRGCRQAKG